jgi:beta-glucosidase
MMTKIPIEDLLRNLKLEEKVSLLSATDWWRTPRIERDGVFVPHIKVGPYFNTLF